MDISAEIAAIQAASQGSELRQPLVGALNKLNSGSLPAVSVSDAGKILKVGANGWEVGEKSGYMPVPTATKQIIENGTYDVTDFANAVVHVSGGGGVDLSSYNILNNAIWEQGTVAAGYNATSKTYEQNKIESLTRIRASQLVTLEVSHIYYVRINSGFNSYLAYYNINNIYVSQITTNWGDYDMDEFIAENVKLAVWVKKYDDANINPSEIQNAGISIYDITELMFNEG